MPHGRTLLLRALLLWAALSFATGPRAAAPSKQAWVWSLPAGFPRPAVPADNPMSAAKVELGRYLFYDRRMSVNGTYSCASCHRQDLAFTDGRAVALGATGQQHPRGAMGLVNVAYSAVLTWGNPNLHKLEEQALTPMLGEHPVELGLSAQASAYLIALRGDSRLSAMFHEAFPDVSDPVTLSNVTRAVASFERSIISARSPYDRYHYGGDDNAVSASAKHGEVLFFSQPLSCFRCHGSFDFSGATTFEGSERQEVEFHNNGLYSLYQPPNVGIYEYTKQPADRGKFKAPTLRNIALTAPYMHDGSLPTLEAVLDHYARGGRHNPQQDELIGGFQLSPQDRRDLIAFLESLTDQAVIHDPHFEDPWRNSSH